MTRTIHPTLAFLDAPSLHLDLLKTMEFGCHCLIILGDSDACHAHWQVDIAYAGQWGVLWVPGQMI